MSALVRRIEVMERAARGILAELGALRRELAADGADVPADVAASVCERLGVSRETLLDGDRLASTVRARAAAALVLHRRGLSYPRIAACLGLNCHTSALAAVRRGVERERGDAEFARVVREHALEQPLKLERVKPAELEHGKLPLCRRCACGPCRAARAA